MIAAIKHVLAASHDQGHCYLTGQQINTGIIEQIEVDLGERLNDYLDLMKQAGQLCTRLLTKDNVILSANRTNSGCNRWFVTIQ